mgnify:CR=1 FL=1
MTKRVSISKKKLILGKLKILKWEGIIIYTRPNFHLVGWLAFNGFTRKQGWSYFQVGAEFGNGNCILIQWAKTSRCTGTFPKLQTKNKEQKPLSVDVSGVLSVPISLSEAPEIVRPRQYTQTHMPYYSWTLFYEIWRLFFLFPFSRTWWANSNCKSISLKRKFLLLFLDQDFISRCGFF